MYAYAYVFAYIHTGALLCHKKKGILAFAACR
jgi:hypothetical protein